MVKLEPNLSIPTDFSYLGLNLILGVDLFVLQSLDLEDLELKLLVPPGGESVC